MLLMKNNNYRRKQCPVNVSGLGSSKKVAISTPVLRSEFSPTGELMNFEGLDWVAGRPVYKKGAVGDVGMLSVTNASLYSSIIFAKQTPDEVLPRGIRNFEVLT